MLFSQSPFTAKRFFSYASLALLASLAMPAQTYAQTTYTIITPLDFGLFAITKNDAAYDLSISENNDLSNDSAYVLSLPTPQRGEMLLEGLPTETEVTITFDNGSLNRSGGPITPAFTITDFVTNQPSPAAFQTDTNGELTIFYGATLRTPGTSQPFQSGTYTGSFDVTIDF